MPDKNPKVDGYSDNTDEQKMDSRGKKGAPGKPDTGIGHGAKEPMSPDEYAKMKREAEEEGNSKS